MVGRKTRSFGWSSDAHVSGARPKRLVAEELAWTKMSSHDAILRTKAGAPPAN